ncbi:unnamed protein product [Aspergillus oryzae]|nr:unnamed protein product [Aspergillus oryzae]GMF95814.1 unnamed protein product [Aspergillus oryzae]
MPVGFGFSVGDIVTTLKIIHTIVSALRESSHATSSFCSLIQELDALKGALDRVRLLDLHESQASDKIALQESVSLCQDTIDSFWEKIQKYQPHLQGRGTNSKLKDAWAKIKWAACKQGDLETFREDIKRHSSSIERHLQMIHMRATTIGQSRSDQQYRNIMKELWEISRGIVRKLLYLSGGIEESLQQGKALLDYSTLIFQAVRNLESRTLPSQIQRQQPVYLIDAFNKESPFHLEFIRSPEALLSVLKLNLKESSCGPRMVDRGDFVIEDAGTQTMIDLAQPWDTCFYPGQRVTMSMILDQSLEGPSCPRCQAPHDGNSNKEITWLQLDPVPVLNHFDNDWLSDIDDLDIDDMISCDDSAAFKDVECSVECEPPTLGPFVWQERHPEDNNLTAIRSFRRLKIIIRKQGKPESEEMDIYWHIAQLETSSGALRSSIVPRLHKIFQSRLQRFLKEADSFHPIGSPQWLNYFKSRANLEQLRLIEGIRFGASEEHIEAMRITELALDRHLLNYHGPFPRPGRNLLYNST